MILCKLPFSLLPECRFLLFSMHAVVSSSPFEVGCQALDERCWLALGYAQLHIAQSQRMQGLLKHQGASVEASCTIIAAKDRV